MEDFSFLMHKTFTQEIKETWKIPSFQKNERILKLSFCHKSKCYSIQNLKSYQIDKYLEYVCLAFEKWDKSHNRHK